jgi:hypothetical protein
VGEQERAVRGDYFAMRSQLKKAVITSEAATKSPIILRSRPAIISTSQFTIALMLTEMQTFASKGPADKKLSRGWGVAT